MYPLHVARLIGSTTKVFSDGGTPCNGHGSATELYPHTPGAAKECAGIYDLADRADIRLSEQLRKVCAATIAEDVEAADGNTNLRSYLRLYDDIAGQVAHVEEPPTSHSVEFHIDQFAHFIHDSLLRGCG